MEARFNKIYDNQGFFDLYNGSVMTTLFVFLVFFIVFSFFYVQRYLAPIKENWAKERCSPMVIPFAGFINPSRDKNAFEYTADNFNYCIKNIVKETTSFAIEPITHIVHLISEIHKSMTNAMDDTRKVISTTRSGAGNFSEDVMKRTLNLLIPLQQMIILFKNTLGKAHAVLTAGLYSAIGGFWFMISALFSVYNLIIAILIGLAATIAILWLIPFGFGIPAAIIMTLTFVAISIPLGIVAGAMDEIMTLTNMNQRTQSAPSAPSCFKGGTLLRGKNNVLYTIESIPLNTELAGGGGFVTALLKLDASKETMYTLGNVFVSGTHTVRYKKKWIFVRNHPDAELVSHFKDKYIYCINTTKKIIPVEQYIFKDWDELDKESMRRCGCETEESVFDTLENGFHPDTKLYVKNIGNVFIKNIEVGHVLKTGETITGIVKIMNNKELVEYADGFIGTRQFGILEHLGIVSPTYVRSNILYHILTDKGHLHIKETKIKDYNWNIDFFNI